MTESDLLYYSPGRLISLWRVILLVSRYEEENIKIKNVVYVVNQLGILGGTIPVKSSIRLAQRCKLLEINSGFVKLTSYCRKLVEGLGDDSEPSIEVLRFLIKTLITHNRFHWLMFFNENADIFKAAIPKEWIDLLESVNLFRLSDESVVDWWKDILGRFYEYNEGRHKEIGDVGEKLTVDYERQRLEADNFPNTFSYVKWVAHFTDSEGYDVLSARGSLLANQYQENSPIYI